MIRPERPTCATDYCGRWAETCGYCVPCWVQMDLEGVPIDAPLPDHFAASVFETDARAAKECGL